MFNWLRRLLVTDYEPLDPWKTIGDNDSATETPDNNRSWLSSVGEYIAAASDEPRTLSAETANKHLRRPLLFEPALRQYSAFRAGEPVFGSDTAAEEWFAIRSDVLQHILAKISESPLKEHLLLRGSALMSAWYGTSARRPGDIDWVVVPDKCICGSADGKQLLEDVQDCLRGTAGGVETPFTLPDRRFVSDDIWMYEKAPGKRMIVPWQCEDQRFNGTVQMDLVFGESLPSSPTEFRFDTEAGESATLWAASRQQSLAWKLMWLDTDCYAQGKDLYDAVLLAESVQLSAELLRQTYLLGDGGYTIDPLKGFHEVAIRKWHLEWEDFQKEYPDIGGTAENWKERLIVALQPLLDELQR